MVLHHRTLEIGRVTAGIRYTELFRYMDFDWYFAAQVVLHHRTLEIGRVTAGSCMTRQLHVTNNLPHAVRFELLPGITRELGTYNGVLLHTSLV